MARNPFWTQANVDTALSLFINPGPTAHLVLAPLDDGLFSDVVFQTLGSFNAIDFFTVDLVAGEEYVTIVSGDYTPTINYLDNQGYLLISEDGDARGIPDGARVDTEWITADYSGRHWITVGWQYVAGAAGSYVMVVATAPDTVGGEPPPPPPGPQYEAIAGSGEADVLDGGDAADSIRGFSGDDTIRGLDGDDLVYGDDGDDDVNGNLGSDVVHGGPGQDFVRGGQGDDTVYGQDGDDWHVNGNIGADRVFGGTGDDQVFGGPGDDTLYGESGDDILSGDLGNDVMYGGPGEDWFAMTADGGWDLAYDFKKAEGDKVVIAPELLGPGLSSWEELRAHISADGSGSALIDLGNGVKLGLLGTPPAWLTAGDFVF